MPLDLVEVVRIDPRAVVVHPLDADEHLPLGNIEGRAGERPFVTVVTDGHQGKRTLELVDVVEVGGADRGEVPFVRVVGALAVLDAAEQLGDDEVEIGVPLAVGVRRHVDRHVVDGRREVGAVVEVDATQVVLVRLALAAVLADDEAGDAFEELAGAQERTVRELLSA